ncbi:histidine phosphatase family protein [Leptothrix discophora]|uniref:Histidine phosphatase family protein n=1 Tax=Leptothrix discophora TaxID=89 RepID=A0ABT9G911_LEPDI|nr:histidine phosphatase family protein [Leptothrix discophora]MDP4302964.1 histidine phosphatase family protein [Leptothrix discophora]
MNLLTPDPSPLRSLTFIRHGQSLANAGGVTMPHHAIPLTPLGHRQAERLAGLLPDAPAEVLVSPFERARDTAAPYLARTGRSARVVDLLREFESIDPAELAGLTGEQRRPITEAYWADGQPDRRMGAQAETFRESVARVEAFMALEMPRMPDGSVVFGHGMWTAMLIWRLFGFRADDGQAMVSFRRFQLALPMPNGAVWHLHQAGGAWRCEVDEVLTRQVQALAG